MSREFEVSWERDLPGTPQQVWDAITVHTAGWLWKIEYEPRVGGSERGLTAEGGTVTAWKPCSHFVTRAAVGQDFNELTYWLEPTTAGPGHLACTRVRYVHRATTPDDGYDVVVDSCRQHTAFYSHSLGQYVRHFAGQEPVYVAADAPPSSADGGMMAVRRAMKVPDSAAVGDRIQLAPDGIPPIDGVIDYATEAFLGVRSADGLYRFYGRDLWGWPVGLAHHLFAPDADQSSSEKAWGGWLQDLFADRKVT